MIFVYEKLGLEIDGVIWSLIRVVRGGMGEWGNFYLMKIIKLICFVDNIFDSLVVFILELVVRIWWFWENN